MGELRGSTGVIFVFLCLVTTISGQLQQTWCNKVKELRAPTPLEMKVCHITEQAQSGPANVLVKSMRNLGHMVKDTDYEY